MSKPFAWSYTALDSFETCARRYFLTKVSKEVADPPGEALLWGRTVHTALQKRLDAGTPLPASLDYIEPVCRLILSKRGRRLVEEKLVIDSAFNPLRNAGGKADFFNKRAWCRGVIDIGLVGERSAVVADWKTGKRAPDNDQLKLFAAMTFAHYPFLQEVHTVFIWLKERTLDVQLFTCEQVSDIWNEFMPRVNRLERAYNDQVWRPTPSGLCGKWCPVTAKHCEFAANQRG